MAIRTTSSGNWIIISPFSENITTIVNNNAARVIGLILGINIVSYHCRPLALIKAKRVIMPEGKPYKGIRNAPVLLIGDSFTGVFELVDCKSAGVGAHIAQKTGLPVDIITSWGGGPPVRNRMVRTRKDYMGYKRAVIYLMVARDLYNYVQGWQDLKTD